VGVRDVVQVPDDLHHTPTQILGHRVVAGQNARHTRDRNTRPLRHVPDGGPTDVRRRPALTHPCGSFTVITPSHPRQHLLDAGTETVSHTYSGPVSLRRPRARAHQPPLVPRAGREGAAGGAPVSRRRTRGGAER
jgi:hypothetical protein